jgi:3-phosphoshikimate 1-carboxyvinyltransferase
MLRALGVPVVSSGHYADTELPGRPSVKLPASSAPWPAGTFQVPGDISSAAFLLVAAAIVPGSDVVLENCGAAPTRAGVLHILERAGLPLVRQRARVAPGGEPVVDLHIRGDLSQARPFTLEASEVPTLVDEIPVLSVLAAFLPGVSVMKGLAELRVKESDRLERTLALLKACGREAWAQGDDLYVRGQPGVALTPFQGYDPVHDHRMAASALVASLRASGPCSVLGLGCLEVSYPGLPEDLGHLQGQAVL